MEAKIEVFTSPTCPYCPGAVRVAKEVAAEMPGVKVIEYDTSTRDGGRRAESFNVMTVPTVFVKGMTDERIGFRGAPVKKDLVKAINISIGKEKFEPKKGIIDKLKGIFEQ